MTLDPSRMGHQSSACACSWTTSRSGGICRGPSRGPSRGPHRVLLDYVVGLSVRIIVGLIMWWNWGGQWAFDGPIVGSDLCLVTSLITGPFISLLSFTLGPSVAWSLGLATWPDSGPIDVRPIHGPTWWTIHGPRHGPIHFFKIRV